jgi:PAS domain S-box-containing protein
MKLRTHLVLLVVMTLLPVLALAGSLTVMLAREARNTAERGLADTTRALQVAIDREILSSVKTLQAVATSEALDRGDYRGFYDVCRRVMRSQDSWHTLTLIDVSSGRTILTTIQPFGMPLPSLMDRPHVQRVITTRQPQVSDLIQGRTVEGRFISLSVPVVRDHRVAYVLAALYDFNALSGVLSSVQLPRDWTGALLDRQQIIIARTRLADEFVGQPATARLAARVVAANSGAFDDVNKEGVPNHGAFARSALSGWTVVVGAPSTALYTSVRNSLLLIIAGGMFLLGAASVVALYYGRRIATPVMALAESAAAFGRGAQSPRVASSVAEVNLVSETIAAAGTERLQAESAVAQAKQALEALIEAAPIAIVVVDREGVAHHWNRAAEETFGWTAGEVIGKRIPFVPSDRRHEFHGNIEQTLAGRPVTGLESERERKDGTRVPVRLFTARLRDPRGESNQIIGLLEDVTERKKAEARSSFLSDAAVVLSSSLDYARVLTALAKLAVPRLADMCAVDVKGDDGAIRRVALVHVDPVKEATARELRDRYGFTDQSIVAEVFRSAKPQLLAEVPDAVLARNARNSEHLALLRTLGIRSAIVVPLVARGAVLGVITLIATEQRTYQAGDLVLANELAERAASAVDNARLYRAAQDANAAKDQFLATLSHELRTPLNAVYGWARMLRAEQMQPEMTQRALLAIERNAEAQVQLIEDLLDVSRIITGKMRLDTQLLDVAAVISAALDSIRPAADAKEIRIHAVLDPSAGAVTGDPARLQQVVWNLLSNAVKFTPKHGRVEVQLRRINSHVEITVGDTGEGIRADMLPVIFERFRQADSSSTRVHQGLGIGLALVRHFVELHGGTVSAESAGDGAGATFRVKLPLAVARSVDVRQRHPAIGIDADYVISDALSGLTVLIIDDDTGTLELMTAILGRAGAEVLSATSVAEGEAVFRARRPDVVVSDIGMPREDGYAFIRRLRALSPEEGGRTPAIAVTAYGSVADRVRSLASGFDNHLPKPVDPRELVAVVARAAGRMR